MSDAKKLREALGDCIVGLDILLSSDQRRKIDGISHDLRGFLTEALEGAREAFIAPLQESRVANAMAPSCGEVAPERSETAGSIEEALRANSEVA